MKIKITLFLIFFLSINLIYLTPAIAQGWAYATITSATPNGAYMQARANYFYSCVVNTSLYNWNGSTWVQEGNTYEIYSDEPGDGQSHYYYNDYIYIGTLQHILNFVGSYSVGKFRWVLRVYKDYNLSALDEEYAYDIYIDYPKRSGYNLGVPYVENYIQLLENTSECYCNEMGYNGYDSYLASTTSSTYTWKPLSGDWSVSGGTNIQIYKIYCTIPGLAKAVGNDNINLDDVKLNPNSYRLYQNYPNPFNPSTIISFDIPEASQVTLKIHDVLGQEVATLVNEFMGEGSYEVSFDASNLISGIYTYTIIAGDFVSTKKMMLVK